MNRSLPGISGIVEYLHVSLQDHVVYKIWYKICSLICWFSLAGLSSMVRRAGPVYWQDNGLPGEAPLPLSEAQHMIIYATCKAGVIPSVEHNCLYRSISGERVTTRLNKPLHTNSSWGYYCPCSFIDMKPPQVWGWHNLKQHGTESPIVLNDPAETQRTSNEAIVKIWWQHRRRPIKNRAVEADF